MRLWGTLPRVPRGILAVGVGVPVALARLLLEPAIGPEAPFMLAWLGILIAAWIGGLWPAAVVAVIGFGVGQHILSQAGRPVLGPGGALIFAVFALLLAGPGEIYQRMSRRRRADRRQIEEMGQRLQRVARLNAIQR